MEQDGRARSAEVEKKVEKILKHIKRRSRAKKDPELVALFEDFLKLYQSLYARQESVDENAHDGEGKENISQYSPSGSDSEYYSSDDIEIDSEIAVNNYRSLHRRMSDNIREELERACVEVTDLKYRLDTKTEEKEAALSKIKELENINNDLRKEVDRKEKRVYALENLHKERVTELEEQLTDLKTKLKPLHHQGTDLEAQLDVHTSETEQQGEANNKALYVRCSEFELIAEKADEVTRLMKQIKDKEDSFKSKIEESMAQISNLKKEVDYLRAQKCEDGVSIACKSNESSDRENVMKHELASLCSQKIESGILLKNKCKEISQYLIQVDTLKGELARKSAVEKVMVEEKEGLLVQLMNMESDVDVLRRQKNIAEDKVSCNIHEINQLREEKHKLQARILELETLFQERGLELSGRQDDSESKRVKETDPVLSLTMNSEIELLQQKLDSLKMEKSQLELQITDQQRITKEREENINKSVEDSNPKQVRRWSSAPGIKLNSQALEKKIEDLAEEFRRKVEDNIRLLYQRIKVAEKIHFENKDLHKKIKEKLELENAALLEKLTIYEDVFRKLRDRVEVGDNAMTILNSVVNNKIEDNENSQDDVVSEIHCGDVKQLNDNVALVVAELDKENEMALLSEKVSDLEAKLNEEVEENLKLMKALNELEQELEAKLNKEGEEKMKLRRAANELEQRVAELEKITGEKDETLLSLQEEKREAIRQLCLLIDYHRCRCDSLKELISKLTVRTKKKT